MLTDKEHKERLELYNQGLSDNKIGLKLYVSRWSIGRWRRKLGLPVNKTKNLK